MPKPTNRKDRAMVIYETLDDLSCLFIFMEEESKRSITADYVMDGTAKFRVYADIKDGRKVPISITVGKSIKKRAAA
jgi:hypothetical protein